MQRQPLAILTLSGTPCQIAFQIGKRRAKKIQKRIEFWNQHVLKIYHGKQSLRRSLEAGFLREAKREAPFFLEEIHAMAEGADVPFSELFRLNLTELSCFVEKCTDLILPFRGSRGRGILIAHNEDWDPRRNDVFLLRAHLPKLSYTVLAYDGYLPGLSAGMNSHGLLHSVNYLQPRDQRMGLPRIFVTRYLVTGKDIEDCLKFIRKSKRAFGQGIHLAQGKEYLGLELTARRMAVKRGPLPAVHTNHYLSSSLKKWAPPAPASSLARYQVASRLLKEGWKAKIPLTPRASRRLALRILSDRSGFPFAIWREADHPKEGSATLATVLMRSDSMTMEIFRDRPEEMDCQASLHLINRRCNG